MDRYLSEIIKKYIGRKIILLSGPRQVGKTTLSKSLLEDSFYLNFDNPEHRIAIDKEQWSRTAALLILDELHKKKQWKSWLKGLVDVKEQRALPPLLVTGSARLDVAKKVGDSLAGRHFSYRLHPLCLKELAAIPAFMREGREKAFELLMQYGGFPEPFLERDEAFALQWRRSHLNLILRHDLLDLEQVREISGIETLVELLRVRVGKPVSYANFARDLAVSIPTVKRWITILENLFVIFSVRPWHRNVARAILKTPKYYFYDLGQLPDDKGARFENLVALALLKELHLREDALGESWKLNYLRNRNEAEIDFLLSSESSKAALMIEAKYSDTVVSKNFHAFSSLQKGFKLRGIQLVPYASVEKQVGDNLFVAEALSWLERMDWSV